MLSDLSPEIIAASCSEEAQESNSPILIVPSVSLPPRVPKILTAIAFKLNIVDYNWVTQSRADMNEIDKYSMKTIDCDELFSKFTFQMP